MQTTGCRPQHGGYSRAAAARRPRTSSIRSVPRSLRSVIDVKAAGVRPPGRPLRTVQGSPLSLFAALPESRGTEVSAAGVELQQ
jgi:hypothetical protein